jgi:hypothetical protein
VLGAASLIVAAVALLVALFSLYVVSLRHANVMVDVTRATVDHSSSRGPFPMSAGLGMTLLVSNDGARAGVDAK